MGPLRREHAEPEVGASIRFVGRRNHPHVMDGLMDITPFGALGDISKLGLMLSEAKQILARLQQAVVAIQADDHAVRRPACSGCGHACHIKDRRLHRVATLFGTVTVHLPRFR